MSVNPVPTLSTDGWVTSPAPRLDYLFVYAFESDFLQSVIYNGKVTSVQWILAQNPKDMNAAAEALKTALITYFQRYYDSATVEVVASDTVPATSATKTTLTIYVSVILDGITYNAGKILSIVDGKMASFKDINNA